MEAKEDKKDILKNLDRLTLEITLSKGEGNIILSEVNSPDLRESLINSLGQIFTTERVDVKPGEGDNIIHKLKHKRQHKDVVIWVMPEELSQDVENALNNYRELFYEYPAPSVIFCTEGFLDTIIKKAGDFWRYRSGLYRFKLKTIEFEKIATDILPLIPLTFSFKTKEDLIRRRRIDEELLKITKDKQHKFFLLLEKGLIYVISAEPKKAIGCLKKAVNVAKEIDSKLEIECYMSLGTAHRMLGEHQKELACFEKALEISKTTKDKQREVYSYILLGKACSDLGQHEKAIGYLERALEIFSAIKDKEMKAFFSALLGKACSDLGQHEKAIGYLERALEIFKMAGDKRSEAESYLGLSGTCIRLGKILEAIGYLEKALEISKITKDKEIEGSSYTKLGEAYSDLGQHEKAIGYLERALEISKMRGDKLLELSNYMSLSKIYLDLVRPQQAITYLKRAAQILPKVVGVKEVYKLLSKAYKVTGDVNSEQKYKRMTENV